MGAVGGIVGGVAGGALGFLSGNQGKKATSGNQAGVNLNDAGRAETDAFGLQNQSLDALQAMMQKSGPGQADYQKGNDSIKSFASMLQDYVKTGGMPGQEDINQAQGITDNLYSARKTALNQSFTDQNTAAQRLAAQLGRSVDDPILQAKLRTGFMKQQDMLSAEQQGSTQQFALALPQQRLGYAQQMTNVLSQYGNQALANQQYLMGIGNQIGNQERNFRLQTSDRWSNGQTKQGGGWIDGAVGALGGIQAGAMAGSGAGGGGAMGMGQSLQGLSQLSSMGGGGGAPGGGGAMSGLSMPAMQQPALQTQSYGFQQPLQPQANYSGYGQGSMFSSPFNPFGR